MGPKKIEVWPKINISREIVVFCELTVRQKLGMILANKMFQILKLSKINFIKKQERFGRLTLKIHFDFGIF